MERITLSVEVMNKIMNVMGQLPYQQVAQLVQEIQQDAKKIEAPTDGD